MARYFSLKMKESFKVGFVAQSPTGNSEDFLFEDIKLSNKSTNDLRKGV
jgi:hypothetical protein